MTGSPKDEQKQRRADRLSAALRDNLKRRKAQTKGRKQGRELARTAGREVEPPAAGSSTETHDSAGFGEDKRNNR